MSFVVLLPMDIFWNNLDRFCLVMYGLEEIGKLMFWIRLKAVMTSGCSLWIVWEVSMTIQYKLVVIRSMTNIVKTRFLLKSPLDIQLKFSETCCRQVHVFFHKLRDGSFKC